MGRERKRFYVVWRGRQTGIFSSWEEARRQVEGYPRAQYKGFARLEDAKRAWKAGYQASAGRPSSQGRWRTAARKPILPSLAVDAAARGPRGPLQYRGVRVDTEKEIFRRGPFPLGTANVGEFLAIVEALRWLDEHGLAWPVYSDSKIARGWVEKGRCRTQLPRTPQSRPLFERIAQAEQWLAEHPHHAPVLKWETRTWGEIPADFNRK